MTTTPLLHRAAVLLAAALIFGVAAPLAVAESTEHQPASTSTTGKEDEPRCVHGCERWGKVCNVDPRGVYKCRRICEKFGEICE
ncbi:MAG: hypothetical protein AB7Q81_11095 [Gammaproteobacteria bacterium]